MYSRCQDHQSDPEVQVRTPLVYASEQVTNNACSRDASKVEIKVLNLLRERDPHNMK